MYNKELYDLVNNALKNFETQIKFNNLTTEKFNEIIEFVNKLEKRIDELEKHINELEDDIFYYKNYKY